MATKYTAGFIGAGHMGGVLADAVCKKIGKDAVTVVCGSEESTAAAASRLGCQKSQSAAEVIDSSRFVFLGIKPQTARTLLPPLRDAFLARKEEITVVTMLAGVPIDDIRLLCGVDRIIRIMPNLPAAVGEGLTPVCTAEAVPPGVLAEFLELFSLTGKTDVIPEKLIDAASALSGCGPAFVSLLIEALADGAVQCGLPRKAALDYAAQTTAGTARLLLETGTHPALLKDAVCSPGGSTAAGICALENGAFRACAMNAVRAAFDRTLSLGK